MVAIIMSFYNLYITTGTILRLLNKLQVDGPQLTTVYNETSNRNNGILGIFIHISFVISFQIFISWCSNINKEFIITNNILIVFSIIFGMISIINE
jgi:hypothetical protein